MKTLEDRRTGLASIPLFGALEPDDLAELAAVAHPVTLTDGQVIALESKERVPVFFVAEGTVKVFKTRPDGRQQTLARLGPGEAFYLVPTFCDDRSAPASTVAAGPTRILRVSQDDLRRVVRHNPRVAFALIGELAGRLRHLAHLTHDLGLRGARGRLARFLVAEARSGAAPRRLTQREIASDMGIARETVSRTLRAFVRDGLVRMDRRRIEILDFAALEAEVESGS